MRLPIVALAALSLAAAVAPPLGAQTLDPRTAEALAAALQVIQDPALRQAAIVKDSKAVEADRQVRALAGSDKVTQDFYEFAIDIFVDLMQSAGGDMMKINETLDRAKADPAAFAATLSPRNLERLKELSTKVGERALSRLKEDLDASYPSSGTTETFTVADTSAARRIGTSKSPRARRLGSDFSFSTFLLNCWDVEV